MDGSFDGNRKVNIYDPYTETGIKRQSSVLTTTGLRRERLGVPKIFRDSTAVT